MPVGAREERGRSCGAPGAALPRGQGIGEHNRGGALVVNAQRGRQLTNIGAGGSDGKRKLAPPVVLSLEESIEYLNPDEYLEATPQSLRLRKSILNETRRRMIEKQIKKQGTVED